jgi:hypothetical protein
MKHYIAAFVANIPSFFLSIYVLYQRLIRKKHKETSLLGLTQTTNLVTQALHIVVGFTDFWPQSSFPLDIVNALYVFGNLLANWNMLWVWLTDIEILGKFSPLDPVRITVARVRMLKVACIVIFLLTRGPNFLNAYYILSDQLNSNRFLITANFYGLALGGFIQMIYTTLQTVFLVRLIRSYSLHSNKKIQESQYRKIAISICVFSLWDWLALGVFLWFSFVRLQTLNSIVVGMIGIRVALCPAIVSQLTLIAIQPKQVAENRTELSQFVTKTIHHDTIKQV